MQGLAAGSSPQPAGASPRSSTPVRWRVVRRPLPRLAWCGCAMCRLRPRWRALVGRPQREPEDAGAARTHRSCEAPPRPAPATRLVLSASVGRARAEDQERSSSRSRRPDMRDRIGARSADGGPTDRTMSPSESGSSRLSKRVQLVTSDSVGSSAPRLDVPRSATNAVSATEQEESPALGIEVLFLGLDGTLSSRSSSDPRRTNCEQL